MAVWDVAVVVEVSLDDCCLNKFVRVAQTSAPSLLRIWTDLYWRRSCHPSSLFADWTSMAIILMFLDRFSSEQIAHYGSFTYF